IEAKKYSINSLLPIPCIIYTHNFHEILTWIFKIDWEKRRIYSNTRLIETERCYIVGLAGECINAVSTAIPTFSMDVKEIFCDNFVLFATNIIKLWSL